MLLKGSVTDKVSVAMVAIPDIVSSWSTTLALLGTYDILLGRTIQCLTWLSRNTSVVDHETRTAIPTT